MCKTKEIDRVLFIFLLLLKEIVITRRKYIPLSQYHPSRESTHKYVHFNALFGSESRVEWANASRSG